MDAKEFVKSRKMLLSQLNICLGRRLEISMQVKKIKKQLGDLDVLITRGKIE